MLKHLASEEAIVQAHKRYGKSSATIKREHQERYADLLADDYYETAVRIAMRERAIKNNLIEEEIEEWKRATMSEGKWEAEIYGRGKKGHKT